MTAKAITTESWLATLQRFTEPKMAMMLILGFTAGLPFLLYFSTLGVWLETSSVDVALIGFFSFFGLSYSFKFLWAPVLDRFDVPGFSRIFGRRRAWIFVAQLGVACGMVGIALADPTRSLRVTALFSFLLAFSSATQDIGIDAWRIEAARDDDEQAPLAAAYQYGYKVGMIISGGVALFIAGIANFSVAYLAMAAIMATAALVFSVWDRESGLRTAAFAGVTLLSVGLFVAFDGLNALFADGSFGHGLMNGLNLIFKVITAITALGFIYYLAKSLIEPSPDKSFSVADMSKGFIFSAICIGSIVAIAIGLGLLIPAIISSLGITVTRGGVRELAVYVALAPLVLAACFVPWIRRLSKESPHLRHPGYGAFVDFFWRHGWAAILLLCFVSCYRLSDIVMGVMAKPAYSAMGYSPEEIGLVSGIYGVWIVFIGVAAAGLSALRLGLKVSLIIGAIVSVLGNITFAWMVNQSSDSLTPLFIAITADNIAGGYAGTVFIAYMSTFVNKSFAGTQYAIFSSVWSLGPKLIAGTSGIMVNEMGYSNFFLFAGALGVPAIILSFFVDFMRADRTVEPVAPPAEIPAPT